MEETAPRPQTLADMEAQAEAQKQAEIDAGVAKIRDYIAGMPKFNIGALCLPPIWGPGHGLLITILWYPVWMMADNCFYTAYSAPSVLSHIAAAAAFVILTVSTFLFAYRMQPYAAHRAIEKGKTKEQFQRAEKIWSIVSIIAGVIMIVFATYYNLVLRVPLS